MADQIFFRIDNISGDSKDPFHQCWIELQSYWLDVQPAPGTGLGPKRNETEDILGILMPVSVASATIASRADQGKRFQHAGLEHMRNGQTHRQMEFRDLEVRSYSIGTVAEFHFVHGASKASFGDPSRGRVTVSRGEQF